MPNYIALSVEGLHKCPDKLCCSWRIFKLEQPCILYRAVKMLLSQLLSYKLQQWALGTLTNKSAGSYFITILCIYVYNHTGHIQPYRACPFSFFLCLPACPFEGEPAAFIFCLYACLRPGRFPSILLICLFVRAHLSGWAYLSVSVQQQLLTANWLKTFG